MEAKLAALEEEISILKGEIKSILQEVRTAVLASENPFSGPGVARPAPGPTPDPPSIEPKVIHLPHSDPSPYPVPQMAPAQPLSLAGAMPSYTPVASLHGPAPEPEVTVLARLPAFPTERPGPGLAQTASEPDLDAPEPANRPAGAGTEANRPRRDVGALAALLAWVEETRDRLDDRHYKLVLTLARYGGLVDRDLEETLLEAGETMDGPLGQERAPMSDCIVALKQLEAILSPEPAQRVLQLHRDEEGLYREVRPSKRQ